MKNWIRIIIGCLTVSCNSQTKDLSEMDFTKWYLESLKKAYPEVIFKIESELTIKADFNGKEFSHYLDNSYKEYQLDKDSLKQVISKYVASSADLYKEKEDINIDRIIPIIKPIDYLNDLMQLAKDKEDKEPWIVYEKYNDKLIIVYGEDTEKSIKYFSKDDFSGLNIDKDTLLEMAVKNLNRILPDIQSLGGDGNFGLAAGGDFEASLILLKSIWTKENFDVDGDFVIAIPNRDLLFITGSNNKAEIERIRDIAIDSYKTGNHQVSPYLFIWTGDKFEEYK
ncbi:DUF1444 family protein [Zhouia sp. PK063]|uniref:DUF1444 family protein n=1 Tax=Zhouia sp. PK063 TaxID=3373602 RepID=UPI0037AE4544